LSVIACQSKKGRTYHRRFRNKGKYGKQKALQETASYKKEIEPPSIYGHPEPEIVIAGWGSTYGVMKEVVDRLSENHDISMLHFSEIYPFPPVNKFNYIKTLEDAKMTICIENNATEQFARLLRAETGYSIRRLVNRFDGRPFTIESLIGEINALIR